MAAQAPSKHLAGDLLTIPYPSDVGGSLSRGAAIGAERATTKTDLPAAVREKLKLLSFVSVLVVLFNHAAPYSVVYHGVEVRQPSAVVEFISHLWQGSFGRVNRLLFFSISGYLFFWTLKPELNGFIDKWRKRLRSLAIPYLIWSLIGFSGFMLLYSVDGTRQLMGRRIGIGEGDWMQVLRTILWDPVPSQFWYVRDLCGLILMSPLVYVTARLLGWWLGAGMVACWLAGFLPSWPDQSGLAFFTLGAVVATRRLVPDWNLRPWLLPSLIVWVLACVLNTVLHTQGIPAPGIIKLGSIAGLVAVWALVDLIRGKTRQRLVEAAAFTFFVFAAHEPLMGAMQKAVFKFIPFNGINSLAAFFLLPVMTLAICLSAGVVLRKRCPSMFGVLTGGRGQGSREG